MVSYHTNSSYKDTSAWADTVDPDQTAWEQSDQGLQCLPFHQQLFDRLLHNNYYNMKMFGIFVVFYIKYKIFI